MIFLLGRDSISSTQQAINMQIWSRLFSSESGMTLTGFFIMFFKIVDFMALFMRMGLMDSCHPVYFDNKEKGLVFLRAVHAFYIKVTLNL